MEALSYYPQQQHLELVEPKLKQMTYTSLRGIEFTLPIHDGDVFMSEDDLPRLFGESFEVTLYLLARHNVAALIQYSDGHHVDTLHNALDLAEALMDHNPSAAAHLIWWLSSNGLNGLERPLVLDAPQRIFKALYFPPAYWGIDRQINTAVAEAAIRYYRATTGIDFTAYVVKKMVELTGEAPFINDFQANWRGE